ncbi:MAG: ABC transporter permease [Hyphomonadaceae bacterium]|nr:ABC transporter permease [Hyphomonadaceae bacterium]
MSLLAFADQPKDRSNLLATSLAGARDILDGCRQWRIWYLMGSSDMRRRYARSKLGQFWIMISSVVMISSIGLVWSYLWQLPVHDIVPFVALGLLIWQLMSGVLGEATTILPANGHYFLNQYMAASTVLLSMLYRHTITLLLNIVFPILLTVALGTPVTMNALLALPGLALLLVACFWSSFVVAILCARFRDVVQIVNSVLHVAMFVTPVLWKPEMLPQELRAYAEWNPLAVLMAVVRDPLLGRTVPLEGWLAAVGVSIGGLLLALTIIGRFRRRLVYWL